MEDSDTHDHEGYVVKSREEAAEQILNLRMGRSGSVAGGVEETSPFMDELYVSDIVDERAVEFFSEQETNGELFVLLGSAGDGKTAIFTRAYNNAAEWLRPEHLNLDATAAKNVEQTEIEDLEEFLQEAQESLHESGEPRRGLAINLGIAVEFFRDPERRQKFQATYEAIEAARDPSNFDEGCLYTSEADIRVANLSHRRLFDTHPQRLGSGLLRELVEKFDHTNNGEADSVHSPFAGVSEEIKQNADEHPIAYNLHQLTSPGIKESIIRLLASRAILSNEYLNPRRTLHYLSSIIVPDQLTESVDTGEVPAFAELDDKITPWDLLLWNTTYEVMQHGRKKGIRLDPCVVATLELDEKILSLHGTATDGSSLQFPFEIDKESRTDAIRTEIRRRHLTGEEQYDTEEWSTPFSQFVATRSYLDELAVSDDPDGILDSKAEDAYKLVVEAIKRWSQQTRTGDFVQIPDGQPSDKYYFLSEWEEEEAGFKGDASVEKTTDETQVGKVWFVFNNNVEIPISYELYRLLGLITEGYNPDAIDPKESEGVRLLHSQLSQFTDKKTNMRVHNAADRPLLRLQKKRGIKSGIEVSKNE